MSIENQRSLFLTLAAVGIGTFMTGLDSSIVNVTMPLMAREFHSRPAEVAWVSMAYLLGICILLPVFGRLGDLLGQKTIFNIGFVLFIMASLFCAISPSMAYIIGSRVFQAVGGSMLMSTGPAILTASFPPERRGQALGFLGTFTYIGLTAGPLVGGLLASAYSWRAAFLINIPIGLLAIITAFLFIREIPPSRERGFDWAGALTFGTGLFAFLLFLSHSSPVSPWALVPLALVSITLFIRIEARAPRPMIDLGLFRIPPFTIGVISALINYIVVFIIMFALPYYFIDTRHDQASQVGTLLSFMPLVMAALAPLAGTLSDRIGARSLTGGGMAILGIATLIMVKLAWAPSLWWAVFPLLLAGIGIGIFVSPNSSAIMGAAPPVHRGTAGGIMALARTTGMVVGVAIASYIMSTPGAIATAMSTASALAFVGCALSLSRNPQPKPS